MSVQFARHYRFTVDQYQKMAAEGYIDADARVELIDGEVVEMSPIGSRHNSVVDRLARLFFDRLSAQDAVIRVQGSIRLNDVIAPQPDLALLRPQAGIYDATLPTPADVLLIVEVADTSLAFDRDTKAAQYAANGIGEYWLVDIVQAQVVVHRSPSALGYHSVVVNGVGDDCAPNAFPGLTIAHHAIFG